MASPSCSVLWEVYLEFSAHFSNGETELQCPSGVAHLEMQTSLPLDPTVRDTHPMAELRDSSRNHSRCNTEGQL